MSALAPSALKIQNCKEGRLPVTLFAAGWEPFRRGLARKPAARFAARNLYPTSALIAVTPFCGNSALKSTGYPSGEVWLTDESLVMLLG